MSEEVAAVIEVLKRGGTILYPTDTIWGLGCDATNALAIKKVKKIKRRALEKNFILLVESMEQLKQYVENVPDIAFDLIQSYDNPLTIIYPKAKNLPHDAFADDGSVAIRIVKHQFCLELLKFFKKPIISSSANVSGEATPLTFNKISPLVMKEVDYVVSQYHEEINCYKASTLIKIHDDGIFEVIRD